MRRNNQSSIPSTLSPNSPSPIIRLSSLAKLPNTSTRNQELKPNTAFHTPTPNIVSGILSQTLDPSDRSFWIYWMKRAQDAFVLAYRGYVLLNSFPRRQYLVFCRLHYHDYILYTSAESREIHTI